jgi:hypothetical protein
VEDIARPLLLGGTRRAAALVRADHRTRDRQQRVIDAFGRRRADLVLLDLVLPGPRPC